MSVDDNTAPSIDSKEEEMDKVNPASGSKICKDSAIQSEAKENLNVEPELISKKDFPPDKNREMPEIKKVGKPMVGLPPINVAELTTILQNPAMPSQDLMKEIAHKIQIRNEENENNAKSISSVNPMGMSSVFDCIMEVTLTHSDDSSDEEEDEHEPHILQIPCDYCKKVFGSTMSLKTHVLMSHSQDDPSVLNMRLRASIDDDRAREFCFEKEEGQKKISKQEKQNEGDLKLHLTSEVSDSGKAATAKSPTAFDTTPFNSSCKLSRSSLRKRKLSTENECVSENKPDLKQAVTETAKPESSSSSSLPKTTTLSVKSGKRKSDDSCTPTQSIKKGKRSRRSMSGENESEKQKEAVQLRRSTRKK